MFYEATTVALLDILPFEANFPCFVKYALATVFIFSKLVFLNACASLAACFIATDASFSALEKYK